MPYPAALPLVRIDAFEGPFDVLLELARARRVDLTGVPLATITSDFVEYVTKTKLPASVRADFVAVAATLLMLKTQRILPPSGEEEVTLNEDEEALRWRLLMYRQYREQSRWLAHRWLKYQLWPAMARGAYLAQLPVELEVAMMARAMTELIARTPEPSRHVARVKQRPSIAVVLQRLRDRLANIGEFVFQYEMKDMDPYEVVTAFLVLLELAHQDKARLVQPRAFSTLTVRHHG